MGPEWASRVRDAWRALASSGPAKPHLREVARIEDGAFAFELHHGRGAVGIDYEAASPGSPWPARFPWLFVGGVRVYMLSYGCGTCEPLLSLVGHAPRDAALLGDQVRKATGDVARLDARLLEALTPLVFLLRSGNYVATLVDLDLERVDASDTARSWWRRRGELRRFEDDEEQRGLLD